MPVSLPLWTPSHERMVNSNLHQFIQYLNQQGETIAGYDALHQWSIGNSGQFWQAVWQFCQVIGERGNAVVAEGPPRFGQHMISARDTIWFPQAQLNYAENLLAHASHQPNGIALWFNNENGSTRQLTWQQLREQVSLVQQWLKHHKIGQGDIVAGYLPYLPETVIAMLATTSLGAIWTSTSPDFGVESVIERFGQVQPKILFCCDGYTFNGKPYDMQPRNALIAQALPSLLSICQIEYWQDRTQGATPTPNFTRWPSLTTHYQPQELEYRRIGFNQPLFVLYSSGTTGKPKCITHSVGGTLLNHLKEHQLHCDIKQHDRMFYYTTTGWMMWNWHVSGLASGATLVIYDGHPLYPNIDTLWHLAEHAQVSLFGTSAKYLETLQKKHYSPCHNYPLHHLKTMCSTGSVLYPEQFNYVYAHIKADLHLASISGGTDICGCFVLGNPLSPVYQGECQSAGLGLDIAAFNAQGEAIIEQRGELVCRNSFPNQPIGFWHDDGSRYQHAYWDKFPEVWHHGDEVEITAHGGVIFFGRSDTVLNPGGVRIGTAEIYQQVNSLPEIQDSIAIGRHWERDEQVILFVQLAENTYLDEALQQKIRTLLREQCSPRHVPAHIYAISEIPRTKSGKLVELAVKQVCHGDEVQNMGAIANPHVLLEIKNLLVIQ